MIQERNRLTQQVYSRCALKCPHCTTRSSVVLVNAPHFSRYVKDTCVAGAVGRPALDAGTVINGTRYFIVTDPVAEPVQPCP